MPEYPWIFEPCENEGPICDTAGLPWSHAVRGRKPERAPVMGYGHTESAAEDAARNNAQIQDAQTVLGERGEIVTNYTYRGGGTVVWTESYPTVFINGYGTIAVMPWSIDA